jgi:DNA-binding transcriptional LysR family regulator
VAGTVRLGYFASVGGTVLPEVLRRAAQELPEVELRLTEADDLRGLEQRVATGELDLALVVAPASEPQLETTPLFDDAAVVLVAPDDPLAAEDTVSLMALRDRRIATFGSCAHQDAIDRCLRWATGATITVRADDNATLAGLVSAGAAVAVMTELSVMEAVRSGLVAVRVRRLPPRQIVVARHRESLLSPDAAALEGLCVEEGARFARESARPMSAAGARHASSAWG